MTTSRCCLALVLLFGAWPPTVPQAHADSFARPNSDFHPVQESESNFTLEGKITQKSEGKLTVSTEQNGAQGSDQDLKTGLTVAVQGEFNESGEVVAHKIQLL